MTLPTALNRPEYFLQPVQIWHRFRRKTAMADLQILPLPWGGAIAIRPHPDDKVEWSLWLMGIYDLALTESLWRLTEPGEMVLDIGANIGYITGLLAAKTGHQGRVIAFEPNPEVYEELVANCHRCKEASPIELLPLALSDQPGTATLRIPKHNRGEAALLTGDDPNPGETLRQETVTVTTGDRHFPDDLPIGVLKIDIEGHELAALKGCDRLLSHHCIRDILYEQHEGYPSPASSYLESKGYTIFRLWKGFWRPLLYPADYPVIHPWEPPNYLATLEPERARARLRSRGWQVLNPKP